MALQLPSPDFVPTAGSAVRCRRYQEPCYGCEAPSDVAAGAIPNLGHHCSAPWAPAAAMLETRHLTVDAVIFIQHGLTTPASGTASHTNRLGAEQQHHLSEVPLLPGLAPAPNRRLAAPPQSNASPFIFMSGLRAVKFVLQERRGTADSTWLCPACSSPLPTVRCHALPTLAFQNVPQQPSTILAARSSFEPSRRRPRRRQASSY